MFFFLKHGVPTVFLQSDPAKNCTEFNVPSFCNHVL